jgi:hypothetical protein
MWRPLPLYYYNGTCIVRGDIEKHIQISVDIQKFRMEAVGSVHEKDWRCVCDCMQKLEQY